MVGILLAAVLQSASVRAEGWESAVKVYKTMVTASTATLLQPQPDLTFKSNPSANIAFPIFTVNAAKSYQTMLGFGGAMTESTAINLLRLPESMQKQVLEMLFSKDHGAGFDFIRLPIGASDFSDPEKGFYTYDDSPNDEPDPQFRYFDMNRDEKSFQMIRAARAINPNLKVMITPWSPPAWMKTPNSLMGGALNFDFAQDLARYFVRVIQEYENRGIPVAALTIQNEPHYAASDYPSMAMSDQDQIRFIRDYLAPMLQRNFLATPIYVHDHNYDLYPDVITILSDPKVAEVVQGIGYHCYEGDYSEMQETNDLFPAFPPFQTECTPILGGEPAGDFFFWISDYVIGPTNLGSIGSMAWNLVLDETGGPHDGGCYGCEGLVTADFSGSLPKLKFNPELFAEAQLSRFLKPGSQRIDVQSGDALGLMATGFVGPSGRVSLIVWNGAAKTVPFRVQNTDSRAFDYELEPNAAVTFVWQEAYGPEFLWALE